MARPSTAGRSVGPRDAPRPFDGGVNLSTEGQAGRTERRGTLAQTACRVNPNPDRRAVICYAGTIGGSPGGSAMRIIAGQRRGHKFDGPRDDVTRPTSDLVRESIFNILGELVVDRTAIDLYAGTGALGLEALSRGASRAVFVELNRDNAALIRRNIATLRYEDRARVQVANAHRWARGFTAEGDDPLIVFLDPPYREYENHPDRVRRTLEVLLERLPEGSTLAVESRRDLDDAVLPDPDAWDVRRYGGTQVGIRTVERGRVVRVRPDEVTTQDADDEG